MMNTEIAAIIISRMTFSAADYVNNYESILSEAYSLYVSQTGDDSPEVKSEISLLLKQSFADRKAISVSNADLPDHFSDGSAFRICVNDTEVEGVLHLTPKDISVEIVSPFKGRTAGAELQLLAPVIWTESPENGSEANEDGRLKAITLLTDIYYSMLQYVPLDN